ncbi:uncharacterized protein, partial [Centruroides vittatus]|uniref:uncharacterized protein n=1 Tax=Centruroides vittatus TaxID=120091 RepID=UPI00351028AC
IDEIKLTREKLKLFNQVITAKGASLANCWGCIDGTARPICRPKTHKRVVFSGHKRIHCLKFQSVVTPDGTIANLFGPIEERRHDSGILFNSRMSSVRVCAEWVFVKIIQIFAFLDLKKKKKNLKLYLQSVGKAYIVGTLLTDCHTCLYGSATSDYFNCLSLPKLDKYFRM